MCWNLSYIALLVPIEAFASLPLNVFDDWNTFSYFLFLAFFDGNLSLQYVNLMIRLILCDCVGDKLLYGWFMTSNMSGLSLALLAWFCVACAN